MRNICCLFLSLFAKGRVADVRIRLEKLQPVEYVEVVHLQSGPHVFTEVKMLGDVRALVAREGIAQAGIRPLTPRVWVDLLLRF